MLFNDSNSDRTLAIWGFSGLWHHGDCSLCGNRTHKEKQVHYRSALSHFPFRSNRQLVAFGLGFDIKAVSADYPSAADRDILFIL